MKKPRYDIEEAKSLVSSGRFSILGKAARFLKNRYDASPKEVVEGVFASMSEDDFYKDLELEKIPGTWADVYKPTYDGIEWYVKFYMEDGRAIVQVLSCNWDGCLH